MKKLKDKLGSAVGVLIFILFLLFANGFFGRTADPKLVAPSIMSLKKANINNYITAECELLYESASAFDKKWNGKSDLGTLGTMMYESRGGDDESYDYSNLKSYAGDCVKSMEFLYPNNYEEIKKRSNFQDSFSIKSFY